MARSGHCCWPQLSERRSIVPPHRELVELKNERKDLKQTQSESESQREAQSESPRETETHPVTCLRLHDGVLVQAAHDWPNTCAGKEFNDSF